MDHAFWSLSVLLLVLVVSPQFSYEPRDHSPSAWAHRYAVYHYSTGLQLVSTGDIPGKMPYDLLKRKMIVLIHKYKSVKVRSGARIALLRRASLDQGPFYRVKVK